MEKSTAVKTFIKLPGQEFREGSEGSAVVVSCRRLEKYHVHCRQHDRPLDLPTLSVTKQVT